MVAVSTSAASHARPKTEAVATNVLYGYDGTGTHSGGCVYSATTPYRATIAAGAVDTPGVRNRADPTYSYDAGTHLWFFAVQFASLKTSFLHSLGPATAVFYPAAGLYDPIAHIYAGDDPVNSGDPTGLQALCSPDQLTPSQAADLQAGTFNTVNEPEFNFKSVFELQFGADGLELKMGFEDLPFAVLSVAYEVTWYINGQKHLDDHVTTPWQCASESVVGACNDHNWDTEVELAKDGEADLHGVKIKYGAYLGFIISFDAVAGGYWNDHFWLAEETLLNLVPIVAANLNISQALTPGETQKQHH